MHTELGPMRRSRIWRHQSLVLALLVTVALGAFGAVEMLAWYRATLRQAQEVQTTRAREVTQAVHQVLDTIGRHVAAVTALPWERGEWLSAADRREEYLRLLRLVPSIESVAFADEQGRELLLVSRKAVDRVAGDAPPPAGGPSGPRPTALRSYGSVEDVDGYDPVLTLDLQFPENRAAGTTRVRLGLRALARELGPALEPADAEAYVVDRGNRVILHRDPSLVLGRLQLPPGPARPHDAATGAPGLRGGTVLRSMVPIEPLGWSAVVEEPRDAVMAPVWSALRRTALLICIGVLASAAAAVYLAGRLTRPIRRLHAAAGNLRAGSLDTRVAIESDDELQDVAEQFNRMATDLQASYANLELKVAEKTHDLALANRHMSEFMANMSHELRTPLNAVIGMSEALQDEQDYGALNDKQREYLQDINASGEHLLSLINDILDLAKIEAGRAELLSEPFDVPSVIANAVVLLRERAQRQGVRVVTEVDPGVGAWTADARRFKQILVNMLSNAVKFTPAGGMVTVRAKVDGGQLAIEVEDTGCGIAAEDQALIFEKFRRVGPSVARTEGTGLGLALVRELVRLHGGDVTVRSTLGVGSLFRFTLPGQPS